MDCITKKSAVNYIFDPHIYTTAKDGERESLFTFIDEANQFQLRPLCSTDYERGYLGLLSQLTETGNVTQQMYLDTFDRMKSSGTYYIIAIEDTHKNQIVASGSLILEKKFIHSCGQRGRVEDIIVNIDFRGKQFGKIIVKRLIAISKVLNCYKISLECKDDKKKWYNSMGFETEHGNSNFMQIRFSI